MKFSSRQVVVMVACVSAAVVLAPVGVMAATGTLVNITDPSVASRAARVTSAGGLVVESRAYQGTNAFTVQGTRVGLGWLNLATATGPSRLAITELTLTGSFDPDPGYAEVLIEAMVRTSGTNGCSGPGTSGYTRHTLKRVSTRSRTTLALTFDGQPLVLPIAAAGHFVCFGITVVTVNSGLAVYAGATGYRFT